MKAALICAVGLLLFVLATTRAVAQDAPALAGVVTFNGVGVPGVTVTAVRAGTRVATTTDLQGFYRLRGLDAGTWTIATALVGFATSTMDVTIPSNGPRATADLDAASADRRDAARPRRARRAQFGGGLGVQCGVAAPNRISGGWSTRRACARARGCSGRSRGEPGCSRASADGVSGRRI